MLPLFIEDHYMVFRSLRRVELHLATELWMSPIQYLVPTFLAVSKLPWAYHISSADIQKLVCRVAPTHAPCSKVASSLAMKEPRWIDFDLVVADQNVVHVQYHVRRREIYLIGATLSSILM